MERSEKHILVVVSAIMLVLITVVSLIRIFGTKAENDFIIPNFDPSAVVGVPEVTDSGSNYNTLDLPISEGCCSLSLDATPKLEENKLYLFLTSSSENTVYVRVILYTDDGAEIGESGLIRSDEYLSFIEVEDTLNAGTTINAKILTFEPDTYYSFGSATVALNVR